MGSFACMRCVVVPCGNEKELEVAEDEEEEGRKVGLESLDLGYDVRDLWWSGEPQRSEVGGRLTPRNPFAPL